MCALLARRAGRPVQVRGGPAREPDRPHARRGRRDARGARPIAPTARCWGCAARRRPTRARTWSRRPSTTSSSWATSPTAIASPPSATRRSVLTNKCPAAPTAASASRSCASPIERTMALLARRLGLDPAELRLRNYIRPTRCPTRRRPARSTTAATIRRRCARARALRLCGGGASRRAARAAGRLLGIGIATSVEPAGTNLASYEIITGRRAASGSAEAAMVRVEPDGHVRVALGDPPSGQGYETVVAQIVADELGLTPTTSRSRAASTPRRRPGSTLRQLLQQVLGHRRGRGGGRGRAGARQAPAHRGPPAGDRGGRPGAARRRGARARRAAAACLRRAGAHRLRRRAGVAAGRGAGPGGAPRPPEPAGQADRRRSAACPRSSSSPTPRTAAWWRSIRGQGGCSILKYVVVHDCGRELNPLIVEGMVHGSTVHGIGAALLEEFRYDEAGQLLTSTFMDYLKPTALDVPDIEVGRLEHPSPFTAARRQGRRRGRRHPGPGGGRQRRRRRPRPPRRRRPLAADHARRRVALARRWWAGVAGVIGRIRARIRGGGRAAGHHAGRRHVAGRPQRARAGAGRRADDHRRDRRRLLRPRGAVGARAVGNPGALGGDVRGRAPGRRRLSGLAGTALTRGGVAIDHGVARPGRGRPVSGARSAKAR